MWGRVNVGGIDLRETITAEQDGASVRLTGQESSPPSTNALVRAAHSNIGASLGLVVSVSFTDKDELTGFYRVSSASSVLTDEHNGGVVTASWALSLDRIGSGRDVEVESHVTFIPRQDTIDGTQVANFWHAPAVGALDYFTGPSVPSGSTLRTSADGVVRVHTGLPAGSVPRWTIGVADYLKGAARLLVGGLRRVGLFTPPGAAWEVHNGLVRVRPSSDPAKPGTLTVELWDGTAWGSARSFVPTINGGPLAGLVPELTALRNDPEEVMVRLTYPQTAGRVTLDLGVRRGSRFVTGVMKRHASADLSIRVDHDETHATVTGGIRASTADASGNRTVAGSALGLGGAGTPGNVYRLGSTVLDFFFGHEVGAAPVAGDAYADLLAQYLGSMGEQSTVVTR